MIKRIFNKKSSSQSAATSTSPLQQTSAAGENGAGTSTAARGSSVGEASAAISISPSDQSDLSPVFSGGEQIGEQSPPKSAALNPPATPTTTTAAQATAASSQSILTRIKTQFENVVSLKPSSVAAPATTSTPSASGDASEAQSAKSAADEDPNDYLDENQKTVTSTDDLFQIEQSFAKHHGQPASSGSQSTSSSSSYFSLFPKAATAAAGQQAKKQQNNFDSLKNESEESSKNKKSSAISFSILKKKDDGGSSNNSGVNKSSTKRSQSKSPHKGAEEKSSADAAAAARTQQQQLMLHNDDSQTSQSSEQSFETISHNASDCEDTSSSSSLHVPPSFASRQQSITDDEVHEYLYKLPQSPLVFNNTHHIAHLHSTGSKQLSSRPHQKNQSVTPTPTLAQPQTPTPPLQSCSAHFKSSSPTINSNTTIEYPLRTRILRHLSSSNSIGNSPTTPPSSGSAKAASLLAANSSLSASSTLLTTSHHSSSANSFTGPDQPGPAAAHTCTCGASSQAAAASYTDSKLSPTVNMFQANSQFLRRQSWGSYMHLNPNQINAAMAAANSPSSSSSSSSCQQQRSQNCCNCGCGTAASKPIVSASASVVNPSFTVAHSSSVSSKSSSSCNSPTNCHQQAAAKSLHPHEANLRHRSSIYSHTNPAGAVAGGAGGGLMNPNYYYHQSSITNLNQLLNYHKLASHSNFSSKTNLSRQSSKTASNSSKPEPPADLKAASAAKKDEMVLHNTNLIRLKSNKLGSSAPNLCSTLELSLSRKNSTNRPSKFHKNYHQYQASLLNKSPQLGHEPAGIESGKAGHGHHHHHHQTTATSRLQGSALAARKQSNDFLHIDKSGGQLKASTSPLCLLSTPKSSGGGADGLQTHQFDSIRDERDQFGAVDQLMVKNASSCTTIDSSSFISLPISSSSASSSSSNLAAAHFQKKKSEQIYSTSVSHDPTAELSSGDEQMQRAGSYLLLHSTTTPKEDSSSSASSSSFSQAPAPLSGGAAKDSSSVAAAAASTSTVSGQLFLNCKCGDADEIKLLKIMASQSSGNASNKTSLTLSPNSPNSSQIFESLSLKLDKAKDAAAAKEKNAAVDENGGAGGDSQSKSSKFSDGSFKLCPNETSETLENDRRWSFASMSNSSSGYGTNTPPPSSSSNAYMLNNSINGCSAGLDCNDSSSQSSQYSSNERLLLGSLKQHQQHQQLTSAAAEQERQKQAFQRPTNLLNSNQKSSDSAGGGSSSGCGCFCTCHACGGDSATDCGGGGGSHGRPSTCESESSTSPCPSQFLKDKSFSGSQFGGGGPPRQRQRARSLSCSPSKSFHDSSDLVIVQNEKFKEKFPKACKQMEENLQQFIDTNKDLKLSNTQIDPAARFVHTQIIGFAKLCLEKSKSNQLTCKYFDEIANSIEMLLVEATEKCIHVDESLESLNKFAKQFLLIVSRVARLLECLEFDPLEFCFLLGAAEAQASRNNFIKTDIPKYIITKLGLRSGVDPFDEFAASIKAEPTAAASVVSDSSSSSSLKSMASKAMSFDQSAPPASAASAKPSVPTETDFEEVKLISNGAYGAVHLVRHRHSGERFAMKKIKKHNLIFRNQLQQVFTERDIMIFTDNPFVVALICTFETKKYLCMVMEYVEGGDVATLIKNMGPLPLDMARTYFAETTLAVEYLHSYGIIHRDLKPDNLLITSLGHIKLTDFGLSKVGLMSLTTNFYETGVSCPTDPNGPGGSGSHRASFSAATAAAAVSAGNAYSRGEQSYMSYCKEFNDKQICGTPQYLAPEVILRQGYGKPVDWWSMGVILYEFLTSFAPFNGNTPDELFANVINGEIMWPEEDDELIHIPEDAKHLILCLLTHDPIKRLGANGAAEIKEHPFFMFIDWDNLLRTKADFIPQLDGPDDTSYFDTRAERYNHNSSDEDISISNKCSSQINSPVSKQLTAAAAAASSHAPVSANPSSVLGSATPSPIPISDARTLNLLEPVDKPSSGSGMSELIIKPQSRHNVGMPGSSQTLDEHVDKSKGFLKFGGAFSAAAATTNSSSLTNTSSRSLSVQMSYPIAAAAAAMMTPTMNSNNGGVGDMDEGDSDQLLLNDDTDNELFASFSSCSSKFRLNSNSSTNSPVIINEHKASLPTHFTALRHSEHAVGHNLHANFNSCMAEEESGSGPDKLAEQVQSLSVQEKGVAEPEPDHDDSTKSVDSIGYSAAEPEGKDPNKSDISFTEQFARDTAALEEAKEEASGADKSGQTVDKITAEAEKADENNGAAVAVVAPSKPIKTTSDMEISPDSNSSSSSITIAAALPGSAGKESDARNDAGRASKPNSHGNNKSARLTTVNRHSYYKKDSNASFSAVQPKPQHQHGHPLTRTLSAKYHPNQKQHYFNSGYGGNGGQYLSPANGPVNKPSYLPISNSHNSKLNLLTVPTGPAMNQGEPAPNKYHQHHHHHHHQHQHHHNSNSSGNMNDSTRDRSPICDMIRMAKQKEPIYIRRGARGFGFTLRAIKVYYGDSDYYTIQHLVIHVDHQGPAFAAGLRVNDIITHVNDEVVCGRMHHEIVKLIMYSANNSGGGAGNKSGSSTASAPIAPLCLRVCKLDDTIIKTGGRKRSPSKSKFANRLMKPKNPSYGSNKPFTPPQQLHTPPAPFGPVGSSGGGNLYSSSNTNLTSAMYSSNTIGQMSYLHPPPGGFNQAQHTMMTYGLSPYQHNSSFNQLPQPNMNYYNHRPLNQSNHSLYNPPHYSNKQLAQHQLQSQQQQQQQQHSNQSLLAPSNSLSSSSSSSLLPTSSSMSNILSMQGSQPGSNQHPNSYHHQSTSPIVMAAAAAANNLYSVNNISRRSFGGFIEASNAAPPLNPSQIAGSAGSAPYQFQQVQPERKKKTTLLRKLSEKRAHKYELQQLQQQQQQSQSGKPIYHDCNPAPYNSGGGVACSSCGSSSSSSSLSISNPSSTSSSPTSRRNMSTSDLRVQFYNKTSKLAQPPLAASSSEHQETTPSPPPQSQPPPPLEPPIANQNADAPTAQSSSADISNPAGSE